MLEWYVLNHDFNKKEIVNYNVFSKYFEEQLKKDRKKGEFNNREELKEYLKRKFMHDYWARAEYEIIVGGLFSGFGLERNKKIIKIVNDGPYESEEEQRNILHDLYNVYLEEFEKIDIWRQLEMNLDNITDYVIKEMNFKFNKEEK